MKNYKITFKHLIERECTAIIPANSKEEALKSIDDCPYEYVTEEDEQGLEIKITEIELVK